MSQPLPDHIRECVERVVEGVEGHDFAIDREARGHGAIALMGTIGIIWGMRPDGSLWEFDDDFDVAPRPLPEKYRVRALSVGSERYGWLAELLPKRGTDAVDCPVCGGAGLIGADPTRGMSGVFCERCDTLGWVTPTGTEGRE